MTLQSTLGAFKKHDTLSLKETKLVKEVVHILHPFKEATDAFQKEHESISVIPGYQHMVNTMSDLVTANSKITYCKGMAKSLLSSLNKRLSCVLRDITYVLGEL